MTRLLRGSISGGLRLVGGVLFAFACSEPAQRKAAESPVPLDSVVPDDQKVKSRRYFWGELARSSVPPVDCPVLGTVPAGYIVNQCQDASGRARPGSRLEILQDARITDSTRWSTYELDSHYAMLRLVSAQGEELSRVVLERPVATARFLRFNARDSVLTVEVDLTAEFGSYNGPLTRIPHVVDDEIDWLTAVDATGDTSEVNLASTLKTVWAVDATASVPTILQASCRPNFDEQETAEEKQFILTFERIYRDGNTWRRIERHEYGYWDFEGVLPARRYFP